ncbi:hypothetical protein [Methanosarcina horonobensis]|uniref:hypothetical protein n=1 Tax=Methanosarcina horonobensis TaxID=418008 RepID=UPI00064E684A|nr:hypothetical protein [Methanosarcina horonobensis]
MNEKSYMGKATYVIVKKEENTLTRGSDVSSVNSIVPTYEDAISLGSIFLLSKLYIDIQLLYPVSYPSAVTLYTWHFPPFILLSFLFFLFQYFFSSYSPLKLFSSILEG